MDAFADFYAAAVNKTLPPAVFALTNSSGKLLYHRAFGSLPDGAPLSTNAVFQLASCTKLITTVAALQCVERGLLSLDGDATDVLTEFKGAKLLEGFEDDGTPILKDMGWTFTLRQLLTHSAGHTFNIAIGSLGTEPILARWEREQMPPLDRSVLSRTLRPFRYEPGRGWAYATGLDLAGKIVERVNGDIRLGEFFQQNIFDPLGIKGFTFHLSERPDLGASFTQLWQREADGQIAPAEAPAIWGNSNTIDDLGGGGLYGTVDSYAKVQAALLRNDGTLLQPKMVDAMFQPQLPDAQYLKEWLQAAPPAIRRTILHKIPENSRVSFGLGGLTNLDDAPGGMSAGSLTWGGIWCSYWWIDRKNDIAGFFGTAMSKFGDEPAEAACERFEDAVYKDFVGA